MQKFKIDREKLLEGLNGSKTGFIYNLLELPDTLILEGELLEGGTVEKCGGCERGPEYAECYIHTCGFNRETLKVPEKLVRTCDHATYLNDIQKTINEIIDYLKAKE